MAKKSPAQLKREIDEALAGASGAHSLYKELVAAGVPIDHHESDLYVRDTSVARSILARHGKKGTAFTSQIDGKRWLDVPFAYEPFWEKKSRGSSHATIARKNKAGTWAVEAGRGLTYDRGDGRGPLLMFNLHRHVESGSGSSHITPVDLDEITHEIAAALNRKKRKLRPSHGY